MKKFRNVAFLLLVFAIGGMYAHNSFAQDQSKDNEYPKIIQHDNEMYSLQLENGSFVKSETGRSKFHSSIFEKKGIFYVNHCDVGYLYEAIFIRGDLATLNIPQTDDPVSVCKFILRKGIYNPTAKEVTNMNRYWKIQYWELLGISEKEVCSIVRKIWKEDKKKPERILRKTDWISAVLFEPEWANTPKLESCLKDIVTEVLSHRKHKEFIEIFLLPRKDFYCKIMPAEEFNCL